MAKYKDLKEQIQVLETEINELNKRLQESICPYCYQVRGVAHGYIDGKEVACPHFAGFPNQIKGANSDFNRGAVT